jgi:hypothetical protein
MSWEAPFDDPILLPSGVTMRSLREAGDYIQSLPDKDQQQDRWQTAASVMLATVEGGPSMFERIAVMQAINPPASRSMIQNGRATGERRHDDDRQ